MEKTASRDGTYWLLAPATAIFLLFLVVPLVVLFVIGFNPPERGLLAVQAQFSLENFRRFFTNQLFYGSLLTSLQLGLVTVLVDILLGLPLAYVMARTPSRRVFTALSILVLASMQLDMTIRLYGMIVIFGNNNGLINQLLVALGIPKLQLIYNRTGITLGLVQATLPFMVFSLIAVLRTLSRSYEEAARSLGAGRMRAFVDVTLPLVTPAIISGGVIVFSLSISSYIVPILLGSSRVSTISMHLYQQVTEMGFWQFGSALGLILLAVSLASILVAFSLSQRYAGSRF